MMHDLTNFLAMIFKAQRDYAAMPRMASRSGILMTTSLLEAARSSPIIPHTTRQAYFITDGMTTGRKKTAAPSIL